MEAKERENYLFGTRERERRDGPSGLSDGGRHFCIRNANEDLKEHLGEGGGGGDKALFYGGRWNGREVISQVSHLH